ncbi:hypothetical protein niasHT_037008 [Heterodera trifolii]|uniref:Uncharacterized protein n=1 Tax=Heterodera trifolii TaxID=157864 RepID=A0ABD2IE88_9BILA
MSNQMVIVRILEIIAADEATGEPQKVRAVRVDPPHTEVIMKARGQLQIGQLVAFNDGPDKTHIQKCFNNN